MEKRPPQPVDTAKITVEGLDPHSYVVLWWDTQEGGPVSRETVTPDQGRLQLAVPPFTRDIACKIVPASFAQ